MLLTHFSSILELTVAPFTIRLTVAMVARTNKFLILFIITSVEKRSVKVKLTTVNSNNKTWIKKKEIGVFLYFFQQLFYINDITRRL